MAQFNKNELFPDCIWTNEKCAPIIRFTSDKEALYTGNILAICDSELEYAYHLMEALGRREDLPFEIQVFSSAEKLCQHSAGTRISLLLIAESEYTEDVEALDTGQILILLERDGSEEISAAGLQSQQDAMSRHPAISKYSSVSAIVRRAMENAPLPGSLGNMSRRPKPITLIGIYTPIGRCLQTTLAFVMGQLLARNHKVLYLNLESYSGLGTMLGRNFAAELTDLLYFLNGPKQQFLAKLSQMVENINGLDICPPSFCGAEISALKDAEWLQLLEVLEESRYDYVILDLSDGIQGLYEILRRCSRIYTIVREDSFAMAKISQYEDILNRASYEDVLRKTHRCSLPFFKKLPRSLTNMTTGELAEYAERMLREDEQRTV